jgi:hypothetical protein
MQITPDDLLREAADMALELRIKDRVIAGLQAEIERLRAPADDGGHGHGHSHEQVTAQPPAPAAPREGGS